jgi:hypothetical protein
MVPVQLVCQLFHTPWRSSKMNTFDQRVGQKWPTVKWSNFWARIRRNLNQGFFRFASCMFLFCFLQGTCFELRCSGRPWHLRTFPRVSTQQSYQETIIDYWSHLNEGEAHVLAIDTTSWTLAQSSIHSHTHTDVSNSVACSLLFLYYENGDVPPFMSDEKLILSQSFTLPT